MGVYQAAESNSSITLIDCVNNFLRWSGASIPQAIKAVTATPAAMLGVLGVKGTLEAGADADLVVLSEVKEEAEAQGEGCEGQEQQRQGRTKLVVDEVWKFGTKIFERGRDSKLE